MEIVGLKSGRKFSDWTGGACGPAGAGSGVGEGLDRAGETLETRVRLPKEEGGT